MDINITILGQIITFFLFLTFTMKFVWPPINEAMEKRQTKIIKGLQDAEEAKNKVLIATKESYQIIKEAQKKSNLILKNSTEQSAKIIEYAKIKAKSLKQIMLEESNQEINYNLNIAKQELIKEISNLSILCAKSILKREIKIEDNKKFIEQIIKKI